MGVFHQAPFVLPGPGKGTFHVTEQLALQHIFRNGGTVYGNEAVVLLAAVGMNRLGHQLFSRAAGPGNQDGALGRRHLADAIENVTHHRCAPQEGGKPVLFSQRLPQGPVFPRDGLKTHDVFDGHQDPLPAEGLGNVIAGPLACGLHGRFDGAESGHDNHRQSRVHFLDAFQQANTVHFWHFQIRDHQVEPTGFHTFKGRHRVAGGFDLMSGIFRNDTVEQQQHVPFIVYDQYAAFHRSSCGQCGSFTINVVPLLSPVRSATRLSQWMEPPKLLMMP